MRAPAWAALTLALSSCGLDRNPPAAPTPEALAPGGVWVAYNLGCEVGCDAIRRGDRIVAIDGRSVASGEEVDALRLARRTPVRLSLARGPAGVPAEVTIVAAPRTDMPPLRDVPPLWTVGARALDRAPTWARAHLFGHAIPALRMRRVDPPRAWMTGRTLHGRPALVVVWKPAPQGQHEAWADATTHAYAQLQAVDPALEAAGIDSLFVTTFRATPNFREGARLQVPEPAPPLIPIFELDAPRSPGAAGLEWDPADLRGGAFDPAAAEPAVLVLDRRGIVRFHARGFPLGMEETLAAAVDFALHDLADAPPAGVL